MERETSHLSHFSQNESLVLYSTQLHCFHKMQNGELLRIALLRYHATNLSLLAYLSRFLALFSRSGSLSRPRYFVSLFVTKPLPLSNSLHVFSLSFACFLFLSQSHSLFFPSVTYLPLLSFPFPFTLSLIYCCCARVALRVSCAHARVSVKVHVRERKRGI